MKILPFILVAIFLNTISLASAESYTPRPEWERYFNDVKVTGTLVIEDFRTSSPAYYVVNPDRAEQRYSPASTFKIPHALFALDSNLIKDEFTIIPWDKKERLYRNWNKDQNLRSSMRYSTVWVYEKFAEEIGLANEKAYLEKIRYGNMSTVGKAPFWVEGELAISAMEQIQFLKKLFRNDLPFSREHQLFVKDIMINEAGKEWILRAKTGWTGKLGWWVGWIETVDGPVFFALNIDTPKRLDDLPKRESITRIILKAINALPSSSS